jgi:integrase
VSPYKRDESPVYYLDVRWRGYPRLKLSTDTTNKRRAEDMERTVLALRRAGRRDILDLLATRRLRLADVHHSFTRNPAELEQLRARAESPRLGDLVDRWLAHLRSPAGVSPLTKRRYAPRTVTRYAVSWEGFFKVLPKGRDATLADLTKGFLLEYRRTRTRAQGCGGRRRIERPGESIAAATMNRDLAALGAFLTFVRDVAGYPVERVRLGREREPRGRVRWLSSEELGRFEAHCPPEWWPFFAVLVYTGARFGEAQGLRGGDVLMHAKRLLIHEGERRVKTKDSVRDLPIPPQLERALAPHLARVAPGPDDLVFPGEVQRYGAVRRFWRAVCKAAEIAGATIHDARHTFGVHAAQAGIPIVRLQKLMGHADPTMTMRYMQHAPEAYMDQDAAAIASHMSGAADQEQTAQAEAARRELKPA